MDADCRAIIECYAAQGCTMGACPACNGVIAMHTPGITGALAFGTCYDQSCSAMCRDAATD
jgi:hypothetical protein